MRLLGELSCNWALDKCFSTNVNALFAAAGALFAAADRTLLGAAEFCVCR